VTMDLELHQIKLFLKGSLSQGLKKYIKELDQSFT